MQIASLLLAKNVFLLSFQRKIALTFRSPIFSKNFSEFFYIFSSHQFSCQKSIKNCITKTNFPTVRYIHSLSILNQKTLEKLKNKSMNLGDVGDKIENAVENVTYKLKNGKKVEVKMDTKSRFKQTIRDYGATVVIFHVCISLLSLGTSYLLVSR